MPELTSVIVAFGANLGNPLEMWQQVRTNLNSFDGCNLLNYSRLYQTDPVGTAAGNRFTNGVLHITTALNPSEFLLFCQKLENAAGRERRIHWGPRPLDLDLIFWGTQQIQSAALTIPHPAAWYRRFVLDPLLDVAPDWLHPERLLTARQLHERLQLRPLIIDMTGVPLTSELHSVDWRQYFPQDQLLVRSSSKSPVADNYPVTWAMLSRLEQPVLWQQADRVSRLDVGRWQNWTITNTIDLIRSALDCPMVIPENNSPAES